MGILEQHITDRYAAYHGDCCEVVPMIPDGSVKFSVYSPPFADLYNYSSSDRDMSNCVDYEEFLQHYDFLVEHMFRVTMKGRITAIHCMDLKDGQHSRDFPGDIIRLHEKHGWKFHSRRFIWKEPLRVAIRTRSLGLRHGQLVKDSIRSTVAGADYLITMVKPGENPEPISHEQGLTRYAGERNVPGKLKKYKSETDQKKNKFSHWIWRQYASSVWDDIRPNRLLPFKKAKGSDDEKHICPLQLDVIERCLALWSNPGDTVLTPFMGVGSEVCGSLAMGRKAIGIELKPTYYRQALRNIKAIPELFTNDDEDLFSRIAIECGDDEDFEEAM